MRKVEKQSNIKRIYDALIKHQGRQVAKDSNRIEIDLSVLLELFSLEDYIRELEQKINEQELIIVNLQTQIKLPELNRENFNKFINKKRGKK